MKTVSVVKFFSMSLMLFLAPSCKEGHSSSRKQKKILGVKVEITLPFPPTQGKRINHVFHLKRDALKQLNNIMPSLDKHDGKMWKNSITQVRFTFFQPKSEYSIVTFTGKNRLLVTPRVGKFGMLKVKNSVYQLFRSILDKRGYKQVKL